MKSPATLPLRVTTPDGPALLIAPFLELLRAQSQSWRRQEIDALTKGGLKMSRSERDAEVCRGKATVLEQLAKDVADQR